MGAGVLAGILVGAVSGRLSQIAFNPLGLNLTPVVLLFVPIREMLYPGMAEDPFFRGFLWGALRRCGWKDIWIVQGMLLWLVAGAHLWGAQSGA